MDGTWVIDFLYICYCYSNVMFIAISLCTWYLILDPEGSQFASPWGLIGTPWKVYSTFSSLLLIIFIIMVLSADMVRLNNFDL